VSSGGVCIDVDECLLGTDECNADLGTCINTNGGYE